MNHRWMPGFVLLMALRVCAQPVTSPTAPAAGTEVMPGMGMSGMNMSDMNMRGMLGEYPMARESSGTSWQPDSTPMLGFMLGAADWSLMSEGDVAVIYDDQGGP